MVPENIYALPKEVIGNSKGEGDRCLTPKILKESMKLNWNFQRGVGVQTKKLSVRGVWIFSGLTHRQKDFP